MNKKLTAILTAMLCMSAPLTAYAGDGSFEDYENFLNNLQEVTITTDTFTYTNNTRTSYRQGFFLESEVADPDLMVVGENRGQGVFGEYYELIVTPINYVYSGVGEIPTEVVKQQFGDRQFEVGDLIKVHGEDGVLTAGGAYVTDELNPNSTMEFIGNGIDVFGEEFARVIRMQIVLDEEACAAWAAWETLSSRINLNLIKGDVTVDDTVNILDSIQINKAVMAGAPLCDYAKLAGDVNENGAIDADDSLMILKETIGLTENFE